MKLYLLLSLLLVSAFCKKEKDLYDDAANPTGETEKLVLQYLNDVPIPEYSTLYNTLSQNAKSYNSTFCDHKKWVGKAKQQSFALTNDLGCGSCVTFAAIGSAELAYYKAFHKKGTFSEQELVDCMYHAGGCHGNFMKNGILHIFNNGVCTQLSYPYRFSDIHVCNPKPKRSHLNKFVPFKIDQNDEKLWKSFIYNYGGLSFSFYYGDFVKKDGVVVDCKGASTEKTTNHAVTAIGYGISPKDKIPYILVRNSWGILAPGHEWGYFKLKVGACNSQLYNYHGFIYDTCDTLTSKANCNANPMCNWSSKNKCLNKYVSDKTREIASKMEKAKALDKAADAKDGVGLKDLQKNHKMRRNTMNGAEIMCYIKKANKNKDVTTVDNLYNQAVSAGIINKKTSKITDYAKFRKMLGIEKPLTTFLATKKDLAETYQKKDSYRFYLIKLEVDGATKYWDPRFNQYEVIDDDFYLILNKYEDGKLSK